MSINLKDQLQSHPEGGFFRRIYESGKMVDVDYSTDHRHTATAIQYLLEGDQFSSWHRIKSDEMWVITDCNTTLLLHEIYKSSQGEYCGLRTIQLNIDNPFYCVKAGHWFAAELKDKKESHYVLSHCIVTPGFDFDDFELASASEFSDVYKRLSLKQQELLDSLMPEST